MKKSLSLLLALAMVFSLFAGVVSAADDTLTTQQKFEALKAKGIFAGKGPNQDPALDDPMTRAEGARIVALLIGAEGIGYPNDTRVVAEQPFPDVAIDAWYAEEIDALKDSGIIEGYEDGTFRPDEKFTVQQLAVVIAKVLGLEPVEGAEVDGAASWAAGYIQALINNGIDFPTNYSENATRGQLVEATYVADQIINPEVPDEQSVVSLTATGAKKLTVVFAKPVEDPSELKFSVKKGAANVAIDSEDGFEWSDDKKSVVIKLASKMTEGTYTVTVEPATDNDPKVNDGTKEVTVTDETIQSIEFLTASDTLAAYDDAIVEFNAVNQYGETSDLAASGFQISVNLDPGDVVLSTTKQEINLKLDGKAKDSVVAVTIVAPKGSATASKTFRVGDPPLVSKVEAGDFEYEDDKDKIVAGDDTAKLNVTAYDQYGNKVVDNTIIANSTTLISTRTDIIDALAFVDGKLTIGTVDNSVTADTDVQISIVANGSGAKTDVIVRVYAPKLPEDVTFGEFTETVAEGDGTIYLPIVVTDQNGEKLSASEIAEHASKFTVYSTNSSVLNIRANDANTENGIVTAPGSDQGKIAVLVNGKGTASVTILITAKNKQQSFTITVQDARVPNAVEVSAEPNKKLLPNAATKLKVKIKDQYGKDLASTYAAGGAYEAEVTWTPTGADEIVSVAAPAGIIADKTDLTKIHDQDITITADKGKTGTAKVTVKLSKSGTVIASVTRSVEVIKASAANDLTYEVAEIGTLYNSTTLPNATYVAKVSKDVTVKAKDANGVEVGLPSVIKSVYSSDENIVITNNPTVTGIAEGTVTLTVTFEPADGIVKVASQTVKVSDVLPAAESLTVKNETQSIERAVLTAAPLYVWDSKLGGDIEMKDQYGISYKNDELNNYTSITKIRYTVSDVKGGTVTVNADGLLTASGAVESFTVTVYSLTNGKTVSFKVTVW